MKWWIATIQLPAIVVALALMGCGSDETPAPIVVTNAAPKVAKDPNSFSTQEADPKVMEVRAAIARGNEQALRDLITATPALATTTVHTGSGNITPLVFAATFTRTNIVDVLLQAGADINGKDVGWLTPLMAALRAGQERIVAHLVARGVDLKAAEAAPGSSPLLNEVIESGLSDELLSFMIERGADLNRSDYNGQTPLHMAAKAKRKETMELLIAKGANQTARNKEGLTPDQLLKQKIEAASQPPQQNPVTQQETNQP